MQQRMVSFGMVDGNALMRHAPTTLRRRARRQAALPPPYVRRGPHHRPHCPLRHRAQRETRRCACAAIPRRAACARPAALGCRLQKGNGCRTVKLSAACSLSVTSTPTPGEYYSRSGSFMYDTASGVPIRAARPLKEGSVSLSGEQLSHISGEYPGQTALGMDTQSNISLYREYKP